MKNFYKLLTALSLILSADLPGLDYSYDDGASYWFGAEYLYWKVQDDKKLIPIIVESPVIPESTPLFEIPSDQIVLGNRKAESKWRSGGRFSLGFWCDDCCGTGVELNYLYLGKSQTKRSASSDGALTSPYLAIPYIDTNTGLQNLIPIAFPGAFSGIATYKITNKLQGAELNSITHLNFCSDWDMDVLGGLRYLNFTESFHFDTSSPNIGDVQNIYYTRDKFNMTNNFYGIQLGVNFKWEAYSFFCNIKTKLGIGAMCQSSKVKGHFYVNDFTGFTAVQKLKGGYYALPSNIGSRSVTRFSVLPEVDVNLGYQITEALQINVGYNFLYVTNVLRAGRQLDRKINPTQSSLYEYTPAPVLVGAKRPKHHLRSSDIWIQGLSTGLEYSF